MDKGVYRFSEIEKKWREFWPQNKTFKTLAPGDVGFDSQKPKCYILDMFPYPSGAGLHIGHPKGYIATDIYSRFKWMNGFNVLHPMGFDSFGLPAEIYAIENNVHPGIVTEQNIDNMRNQLKFLGLSYDWDREIATSRPEYYQWTQWIFLQLFNSWFDPDVKWKDELGHDKKGKARPIDTLIIAFQNGRALSSNDLAVAGVNGKTAWKSLSQAQQQRILNTYRLVYHNEVTVNWCPALGTVLANEEVTSEGKSERGDHPVYQRPLRQWIMRITAFGDRLLEDLDVDLPDGNGGSFRLNWPDAVKKMQENWIGRSEGAEVGFEVLKSGTDEVVNSLLVFTTRPDTLFGATFMVVAPKHPLVDLKSDTCLVPPTWPSETPESWKGGFQTDIREAITAYQAEADQKALSREDDKNKTGVFAGFYGLNPVNGQKIPIFVADYVSMDYGSGAIMAVPAHDDRDYAFAKKYNIEIVEVVKAPDATDDLCFTGNGISINSPTDGENPFAITGLPTPVAKSKMIATLEEKSIGTGTVNYRLRDWIFSRQRYWGEPFPLATTPDGFSVPVELPVILPEMEDFRPESSDDPNAPIKPPLGRADASWRTLQVNEQHLEREYNVMPQWAGSCWYYLRFIDPKNKNAFCDPACEKYFMPIDLYVGGAEHAVLHLLYARFWHKALYDLGHVSTPEPFKRLFNQGMITADAFADERGVYIDIREVEIRDGVPFHSPTGKQLYRSPGKMGKRYKNGLPPEEVGLEFGVDALRIYEMYMGPLDVSTPWSMDGIRGMQRFLQRFWRNFITNEGVIKLGGELSGDLEKLMHKTILRVTDDINNLRFNTAIAGLIELNNAIVQMETIPIPLAKNFLLLLSPFAPHICEELWQIAEFGTNSISKESWPIGDETLATAVVAEIAVQVNGKMRARFAVDINTSKEKLEKLALEQENVKIHTEGKTILKVIVVPSKLVNIVVR